MNYAYVGSFSYRIPNWRIGQLTIRFEEKIKDLLYSNNWEHDFFSDLQLQMLEPMGWSCYVKYKYGISIFCSTVQGIYASRGLKGLQIYNR